MGIRITGIDVPFGGISWEYTETEKQAIQKLFFFLESKRLLTNPIEMEIKQWCIESALEIKRRIGGGCSLRYIPYCAPHEKQPLFHHSFAADLLRSRTAILRVQV